MYINKLSRGAGDLGLVLSDVQIDKFTVYLNELQRWNKTYNLTTILDPAAIIRKHFLDSLNYASVLNDSSEVLDFGTGPGFPGLPLAIIKSESRFVLIDGRRKKTLFLDFMVHKLGLENVEIIHLHLSPGNAREVFEQRFSHIVTRAVNLLREVVPVASTLLQNRGTLVFSDAHPDCKAIELGLRQWPELSLEKLKKCTLPGRAPTVYLGIIRKNQHEIC